MVLRPPRLIRAPFWLISGKRLGTLMPLPLRTRFLTRFRLAPAVRGLRCRAAPLATVTAGPRVSVAPPEGPRAPAFWMVIQPCWMLVVPVYVLALGRMSCPRPVLIRLPFEIVPVTVRL